LTKDFVSQSQAIRIEGRVENAALGLFLVNGKSIESSIVRNTLIRSNIRDRGTDISMLRDEACEA